MIRRLTLAVLLLVAPAPADTPAKDEAIRAAPCGNTVQGNMSATGAHARFYAADGTIKGGD